MSTRDTSSRSEDPWFHAGELSAQSRWGARAKWSTQRRQQLLWRHIPHELIDRINEAPYFFIATSDASGACDCSFKGGGVGTLRVIDSLHVAFGDLSGNGAFMSIGNILQNPNIGILLIDFGTGERLRINGRATVHDRGTLAARFPGFDRVVLVEVREVVPNCASHIPKLTAKE